MQAIAIRIVIMTAALLLAAVGLIAFAVFLCVALYSALELVLPPPWAALSAAGIVLLLSILIVAIGSAIARAAADKVKADREKRGAHAGQLGLELGRLLGETAYGYVRENPTRVLVGSIVAGFVLGAVPKLRSFLMGFLKR